MKKIHLMLISLITAAAAVAVVGINSRTSESAPDETAQAGASNERADESVSAQRLAQMVKGIKERRKSDAETETLSSADEQSAGDDNAVAESKEEKRLEAASTLETELAAVETELTETTDPTKREQLEQMKQVIAQLQEAIER